jgi:hypothetical protein
MNIAESVGEAGVGLSASQFAGPSTYLAPMPTAVVILTRGMDTRNRLLCEAYLELKNAGATITSRGGSAPNLILTRWPLAAPQLEPDPSGCDRMVLGYDFTRAQRLLDGFKPAPNAPAKGTQGPFIMEFLPTGGVILIDGSDVPNDSLEDWARGWVSAARAQSVVVNPVSADAASAGTRAAGCPRPEADEDNANYAEQVRDTLLAEAEKRIPLGKIILGGLRWVFGAEDQKPQPAKGTARACAPDEAVRE